MKGPIILIILKFNYRGIRTDKYAYGRTSLSMHGVKFFCHIQFIIFTYFLHDQGDFLCKSNVTPSIWCIPPKNQVTARYYISWSTVSIMKSRNISVVIFSQIILITTINTCNCVQVFFCFDLGVYRLLFNYQS